MTITPWIRLLTRFSVLRKSLLFVLALIIVSSCNRNAVVLDYTNARDEVPQLGNLTFRFNKALVNDSLLNKWDSTEFVSFEPKIAGKFRWEHPDELVFSPSAPLSPATSFKASLNNAILTYSAFNKIEDADNLSFSTAALQLENTNVLWVLQDEASKLAVPQIDLYFNYPVDPADLKDKLAVEIDGKRSNFSMQTLSTDRVISIRMLNVKAEDKEYEVKIILDKGLLPKGGVNGSPEPVEFKSAISSPFVLTINDVETEHDGTTGIVRVKTSQQVIDASISSFIKIDPSVKFTTEYTDDGFIISSDGFDTEQTYTLTAIKGLRGKINGVLKEDHTASIAFGKLEPSIKFGNSKGVYLSGEGNKNIEIRITNVAKMMVVVSKIYENNLLAAHRYGYTPKASGNGNEYDEYDYGGSDLALGDIVYEQEIDTRSLPKYGGSKLLNFNIADRLPEFKGIYHIMIRSTDDYWVRYSRFISLSDLGLIAKEGKDKLVVFANSIKTAAPSEGVNLVAYGENNQVLGTGATNAEGVAEIAYARKEFAGFRPAMIIAKTASDFNYLPFHTTRVNTSRFEVGGSRSNKTGLDAFIYAERDIYRPGERVNFSVIIRDRAWKSPGDMPVKLKFLLPNGKEFKTFRKSLNEQGSLEGSVDIASSGITGSYLLEVYTSNDVLLSAKSFMIEEFVPDRIKVSATLDKPFLTPGSTTQLKINAVNFFGPPASNRNYEAEIQLKQKYFSPKKFDNYNFGLANQSSFYDKIVKEGKTDASGNATEEYQVPDTYRNLGILQATFYATVFDETGRPVSKSANADIYTQDIFAGIGYDGYDYFPLNQAIKFALIAVNKNEAVANGSKLEVKVVKHEYRTVLSKSGSYFSYQSQKEDKLLNSNIVTVTGENTSYSFVPRSPGEYELRVSLPGANSYVSSSFYSYGSWGGDNNSFEVNNEGHIDIELDKAAYLAGETVKALFKTPFSGKLLVTMETDKLVSWQYVNVSKRSASVDLKLTAEHLPNVYITATLIKPHDVSDIPLTVAHGFQNVKVEEKDRKLDVQIIAQKAVRSRTRQKVSVKAESGSYITLAAVDN
ncbi:MAG: alpha-2-macroglobulin family protein, partial [Chitinophagaceae bacterium]|nr:alpha-2-macroglobulin family protein [Chitinophagaceae bacterium]